VTGWGLMRLAGPTVLTKEVSAVAAFQESDVVSDEKPSGRNDALSNRKMAGIERLLGPKSCDLTSCQIGTSAIQIVLGFGSFPFSLGQSHVLRPGNHWVLAQYWRS
jgi:hypothetical protein